MAFLMGDSMTKSGQDHICTHVASMDLFGREETSEGTSNNDYMTLQECHDFGLRKVQSKTEIVATSPEWI